MKVELDHHVLVRLYIVHCSRFVVADKLAVSDLKDFKQIVADLEANAEHGGKVVADYMSNYIDTPDTAYMDRTHVLVIFCHLPS